MARIKTKKKDVIRQDSLEDIFNIGREIEKLSAEINKLSATRTSIIERVKEELKNGAKVEDGKLSAVLTRKERKESISWKGQTVLLVDEVIEEMRRLTLLKNLMKVKKQMTDIVEEFGSGEQYAKMLMDQRATKISEGVVIDFKANLV